MRSANKPASLSELIGSDSDNKSQEMCLDNLPSLLGEKMPDLPYNRVGRYRLMQALKIRFGSGFQNIPGIKNILNEFDKKVSTENVVKANKESRNA